MSRFTRRDFLKFTGAASALGVVGHPFNAFAAGAAGRVVVIGGGFGGATVAKYLHRINPAGIFGAGALCAEFARGPGARQPQDFFVGFF